MARLATSSADRFVLQLPGPGALELPDDLCHVGKHVRVSVRASVFDHSPFYGDSDFLASAGTAIAATLNHDPAITYDYPDAIPRMHFMQIKGFARALLTLPTTYRAGGRQHAGNANLR